MSELEHHMEHAAHAGEGHGHGHDHGGALGRDVGIAMAALGMILALCSALVGAERTKFVAALVAQTNTSGKLNAIDAKHRVIQAQLQQLHAHMPEADAFAESTKALAKIEADAGQGTASKGILCVRLHARNILETVTPTQVDLDRFAWLVMKYNDQREAAHAWTESYESVVDAHHEAAEHYEIGQLCGELGIIFASIAMLFRSRKVFCVSALLGIAGLAIVIHTWQDTQRRLRIAEKGCETSERRFVALSSEAADERADEELVKEIETLAR